MFEVETFGVEKNVDLTENPRPFVAAGDSILIN